MKYHFHFFLFCFFSVSLTAQPLGTTGSPASTGNTYALIIGVANYLDPDIPKLQFANRDAEIFAEFLRSKAGGSVPKENIRLLIDSAATTGAVYDAVYWLKSQCKKDDIVYFYFSGHGDLENITMYNNGFLICYDSPPFNYVKLALSIDYLNDIANTLSLEKQANVILITDACHSGKLTEKKFKGNFLAGNQLRKVRNKEIRITSSSANELSNEKEDWGGGRGVFSYYLVNGLQGVADKKNTGFVTVADIKNYLDSSLLNDEVLKRENIKQTPVVNGNQSLVLTKVNTEVMVMAKQMITEDQSRQRELHVASPGENISGSAEEYFFSLLSKESLEALTDSFSLNEIPKEKITFRLIEVFKNDLMDDAGEKKLTGLEEKLRSDNGSLKLFNNRLASLFDAAGQRVITQYLKGDAAELEKRRYYNANNNDYDVYVRMFEVALKLVTPDNLYYQNLIRVKLHYFTGVAARLKIPVTVKEKQKALIDKAFAEQKKALAIEEYAPYIYNELGILYSYKKMDKEAEANFKTAAARAPNWSIPLVNLSDLYAENDKLDLAILFADSAKKLQPGFQDLYLGYGIIHEKKANLLQAEEAFQKSIKLNNRHFLPFERLGYVYMNTMQFAAADSMFFEAAERKKGFHFNDLSNPRQMKLPKPVIPAIDCFLDTNTVIKDTDLKGLLAGGLLAYRDENMALAENWLTKALTLDNKNPLAYYYLAKTMLEQKRWREGEIFLKKAIANYLPYEQWFAYYDSVSLKNTDPAIDNCIDICFRQGYYNRGDDILALASLYQSWGRFDESEMYYRKFIEINPLEISGYIELTNMFEKAGRYNDAEILLQEYNINTEGKANRELDNFYKRITDQFPDDAAWNLKAGIFQYKLAQNDPGRFLNDTKMTDPLTGMVVYSYVQRPAMKMPGLFIPRLISYGAPRSIQRYLYDLRPFTDGIRFLKKSAENLPYDERVMADITAKLGDLYTWQGLPDSAVYFYETSIDLNPANTGTRNKLVETYSLSYRYTEAVSQLDSLLARGELNMDKQLLLAEYNIHDGRFSSAEKLLTDAARIDLINPAETPGITLLRVKLAAMSKNIKQALDICSSRYMQDKEDSINLYTMARLHALSGNRSEAWKWLELALQAGFRYKYVIEFDPALKIIQKEVKWKKVFPGIQGKAYWSPDQIND